MNASFDRLVIYKDNKTGKIDQRILTYLPDSAYLNRHHNDASNNHVDHLDADYTGYIMYKTWDGKLQSVLRIINGKGVNRMYPQPMPTTRQAVNSLNTTDTRLKTLADCTAYYLITEEDCVSTDPEGEQWSCTYTIIDEEYLGEVCTPSPNDPCNDPTNMDPSCGNNNTGGGGDTSAPGPAKKVDMSKVPAWGKDLIQKYDGSCAFKNLAIIAAILGVSQTEDGLITQYAISTHQDPVDVQAHGIPVYIGGTTDYSSANSFVSTVFNETPITLSQLTTSIDNGNPALAFIFTGTVDPDTGELQGHFVTVYGYTTDSNGTTTYYVVDTRDGLSKTTGGTGLGDLMSISKK